MHIIPNIILFDDPITALTGFTMVLVGSDLMEIEKIPDSCIPQTFIICVQPRTSTSKSLKGTDVLAIYLHVKLFITIINI